MTETLTFDQLPLVVSQLNKKLEIIERLLLDKTEHQSKGQSEQLLTIQEAGEFLHLAIPTIYSKVSRGELPVMKRSKRLYFSRNELMEYLKQGRRKSNVEIETEAQFYLLPKKKRSQKGGEGK